MKQRVMCDPSRGRAAQGRMRGVAAWLCILCALLVCGGCTGRLNVSERMMWSTYPLITKKGAATGFIINQRDSRAPDGVLPVVLTSAHVLESMGNGPLLIGSRLPDAAESPQLSFIALIPAKAAAKKPFYVRHPSCDLAAFYLQLPAEFKGLADLPSYLDASMLARAGREVRSGVPVSFVGYPSVLPGTDGSFPVLRSGRVASYPVGAPLSHGCFLINSDVYPGDSGAPVFIADEGSRPHLAGMVVQRISRNARANSQLAVAVDADKIRETLDLLAASEDNGSGSKSRIAKRSKARPASLLIGKR